MADKPESTILNVDDSDNGRETVSWILRDAGYEVIEASTGMETLSLAAQQPDLVLLDVNLPDISGFEVCRRLKANPVTAPIPVLHLSASAQGSEAYVQGLEGGADGYLVEPVDAAVLLATVRALLRAQRVEMAPRERDELLRLQNAALEAAANGIMITDRNGTITWVNLAFTSLTGYAAAEAIGQNARLLNSGKQKASFYQELWETILSGQAWQGELIDQRKDGSLYVEEQTITPVLDSQSEITHFIAIKQDVTRRRKREHEMAAIVSMSASMRTANNRSELVAAILSQLLELLKADGAALATYDLASNTMVVELGVGAWSSWTSRRLAPGKEIGGYVLTTGRLYVNNNVQDDPLFTSPELFNGLRAVAFVPLVSQERFVGAFWIGSHTNITQNELNLLNATGDIVANAMRRINLHERTTGLLKQLEGRERFITRILESIPSSLVVIDRALRVVSANRNFLEKTRREEQTTIGRHIDEVFPRVLLEYTHLDQKIRAVFLNGQPIEGGKLAYRAPGLSTHMYYYRLIPTRASGEVENVMLLMDDITEQEQLGKEVRQVERHLAGVVDCADDLVISLNPQGQILTWNRAAERISGLSAAEVKGRPLLSFCPQAQQKVIADMLGKVKGGTGLQNIEVSLFTPGKQEVPIAWNCSPMLDDSDRVTAIVAVGRDLTEQRRLKAQLIQSAKVVSLGVMAGGIAHELRNPLAIISAAAQLLLESPDDVELSSQAARKVYAATQRASLIIENLLRFAHPPGDQLRPADVHAVLKETINLLANQMTLHKITLRQELQAKLPRVLANPELLQQVFTNLILNACNAMSQGGALRIVTETGEANEVKIYFSDTGKGIPPEDLSRVFDPFFTTMPTGKGTGLGLSISYSIIRQHQGTIEVTSQVGRGTTFTICLPAQPE